MKTKNFKNGVMVQIKPNGRQEAGIPADKIGATGELTNVRRAPLTNQLVGEVNNYSVFPEHVRLIEKPARRAAPADELTPGFYTDRDGDLWIVAGEPLMVTHLIGGAEVRFGATTQVEFAEGHLVSTFAENCSDTPWYPLTKVADLPKY